ncbi:short-chain dehydrogenase [Dendryphion nanum]|uniref:Short-chain dehydrogenase n=1 Tax=Dendryphion nanum TaxID=256645 RepID=A0A9P9D466_9PLEO|nr:short-chain dehydrogenase [Dendryphion nanum]
MASMSLAPYHDSSLKLMVKGIKTPNQTYNVSFATKTVLITGSNSGIGLACAKILPTLGLSRLIMAVRSVEKGEIAAAPIRKAFPDCKVEVWPLDMLSYPSIQAFAERCTALPKLDIAILNAGLGSGTASRTNPLTGHEETIQVNYISTTLLSVLLLPILSANASASNPGRLTIVGSGTSLIAAFENRNANPLIPSFDVPFSGALAGGERYSTSKLLVNMLVHKLSQYVDVDNVIVNTVEPGLTSGTALHRDYTGAGKYLMAGMKKLTAKTTEQAAWTYIDAVTNHGKESHGGFIMFWKVCGFPKLMYTEECKAAMERLWVETMAELEFAEIKT